MAVARVLVDTGLAHLDRLFDYAIPERFDSTANPGVRVKVRFAGRPVEGWIVERVPSSEHRLSPLTQVVSPEPVLAPEIYSLATAVAERFAGITSDVLRSAIPPRSAKVEKEPSSSLPEIDSSEVELPGGEYPGLRDFLARPGARASWQLLPGADPWEAISAVIRCQAEAGVLVVVPDARDVRRLADLLRPALGERLALLTADFPVAERYRNFLRASRGLADVVLGTRSAIFAPIKSQLIIVVDDGDESHVEPHAPGWNTRAVAAIRAYQQQASLLIAGHTVSVETQALVESGWLGSLDPDPAALKAHMPVVSADLDTAGAKIPSRTWKVLQQGLRSGPVLVQASRVGYRLALSCSQCRSPAECNCGGRLIEQSREVALCPLCGARPTLWKCPHCGGTEVRSRTVGADRLVEELGKAFPQVPIVSSTASHPIDDLDGSPRIVIATTGVEPPVSGRYAAVVILDAETQLLRSDLRVDEECRRRWFNALSLTRPQAPASIVGPSTHPTIQSLIRWSPRRAASRDGEDRERLHLMPRWNVALIEGADITSWVAFLEENHVEILGPYETKRGLRVIARRDRSINPPLAELLRHHAALRASRKESAVRLRLDPYSLEEDA